MKVSLVSIRNFRRLEDVQFSLEDDHTVFVGPNNSGKTSAASAFRLFFRRGEFAINDFTVPCISDLNKYGEDSSTTAELLPAIEMDLWLSVDPEIEFGRVFSLLPNISTNFEKVGIRLRYCVKDADLLRGCNHRAGHIRLNTELVKKPKDLLEYVIVHEMVHLLEPTHSQRFMEILGKHYPTWREARAELNELPLTAEVWKE